jgi:hypothetical protein
MFPIMSFNKIWLQSNETLDIYPLACDQREQAACMACNGKKKRTDSKKNVLREWNSSIQRG